MFSAKKNMINAESIVSNLVIFKTQTTGQSSLTKDDNCKKMAGKFKIARKWRETSKLQENGGRNQNCKKMAGEFNIARKWRGNGGIMELPRAGRFVHCC
jgi:hypothetical protein